MELGVRTHFVSPADTQLFLAESPSLTRSGLGGSKLTEELKRPSAILRREGNDGLITVFVAVHEPYYGAPKILSVHSFSSESTILLQIDKADSMDAIHLNLEGGYGDMTSAFGLAQPVVMGTSSARLPIPTVSSVETNARFALVSFPRVGQPTASMIDGTELKTGPVELKAAAANYRGVIQSVTSRWEGAPANSFTTTAALPTGEALRGSWMNVSLGNGAATEAFEIDHIEASESQTTIFLKDESGLRMNGATTSEIFFPRRQFTGPNTFTIYTHAITP